MEQVLRANTPSGKDIVLMLLEAGYPALTIEKMELGFKKSRISEFKKELIEGALKCDYSLVDYPEIKAQIDNILGGNTPKVERKPERKLETGNSEMEKWKLEVEKAKLETEKYISNFHSAKNSISTLEAEKAKMETDLQISISRIRELEEEIHRLEMEVQRLEISNSNSTSNFQSLENSRLADKREISRLTQLVTELEEVKRNLSAKLSVDTNDLSQKNSLISELEAQLNKLKAENEGLKTQVDRNANAVLNQAFEDQIGSIRKGLPIYTFRLLIGVYAVSGVTMAIFHVAGFLQEYKSIPVNLIPRYVWGYCLAGVLVPFFIQGCRAALGFFFQLNPFRIGKRLTFTVISVIALAILSMIEAFFAVSMIGNWGWTVSVLTLMLAGLVIEILVLREMWFTSMLEAYRSGKLEHMKNYHIEMRGVNDFLKTLNNRK